MVKSNGYTSPGNVCPKCEKPNLNFMNIDIPTRGCEKVRANAVCSDCGTKSRVYFKVSGSWAPLDQQPIVEQPLHQ